MEHPLDLDAQCGIADVPRRRGPVLGLRRQSRVGSRAKNEQAANKIVSAFTPTREPIRSTAWCIDSSGSSCLASATSRIARSRNFCGYFLGADTRSASFRGFRPSTKAGAAVQGLSD
jgi:hypothetical protein